MKKVYYILIILLILGLMEGVAWMVIKSNEEELEPVPAAVEDRNKDPLSQLAPLSEVPKQEASTRGESETPSPSAPYSGSGNTDSDSFPPPSTEVVNGRTERTIHMGVRQYAWDPSSVTAKKGELVRLVVHNADVKHGLVIPDLGVNQDIPEDGAVVEFVASKVGTFEFFCSVWCGEGHMEMRGKIVIE